MTEASGDAVTLAATCVAVALDADAPLAGAALIGAPGAGKSDLALRLIDGCRWGRTRLIADDQTRLALHDGAWRASAPEAIAGALEVRGVGIIATPPARDIPMSCVFDLDQIADRLPARETFYILDAGPPLPVFTLAALEASAPAKIRAALLALRCGLFRDFRQDQ